MDRTFFICAAAMGLAACSASRPPAADNAPPPPQVGLPNPASVFCWQQGGRLRIAKPDKGELTLCLLPNGHQVEEWAFYRGQHNITPSQEPPQTARTQAP